MEPGEFTVLLRRWSDGEAAALEELTPIVYKELHHLAKVNFARESSASTLQPTALLHEAFIKLAGHKQEHWHGRAQFFSMASRIMRQVLIEHARARKSIKRGSGERPLAFEEAFTQAATRGDLVLALDDALGELAKVDERKSRLIELKYFGGLKGTELAEALGISIATVNRESRLAEAWLHKYLAAQ